MNRGTACGINRYTTNDFSETALCYVLAFLLFILRYFPQPFHWFSEVCSEAIIYC
jgi:hypothetical protein